ncbi:aminotransferase class V-fold PLP-dependent enzyme [Marisediminicola senii]|uniref:aminotransferase class V-fold PLP-dependent enzyme n=1 Tax=Marisediminicola senii TaxID=2711233 RepID=UPI0013EA8AAB|nr:aminotransferase class V-fold PLP-dependent enzyme [Marisediminicola senii]
MTDAPATSRTPSTGTTPAATVPIPSPALAAAIASFGDTRGYLAAASSGVPTVQAVEAMKHDLDLRAAARRNPMDYDAILEATRAHYAHLVGVTPDRVATGSQTSVLASVVAAAIPAGAEVLCVDGDFSSIVFPFLQRDDITVRHVAVTEIADSITDSTWLVAFSHIQSLTGTVADAPAIVAAAALHGAHTLCDTTQSAGVHPVDASLFDATVCHAYKWLSAPRGVAFLTLSPDFQQLLTPLQAGWYAGESVWQSCYGPTMTLAPDARQFDVSPAWPAWVGAEHTIGLFASLDMHEVWARASGLGDLLCDGLGIPRQHQAIVTWADPDGEDLARLIAADIRATGRAGQLRAAMHIWNDEMDVAAVVAALRS